MPTFEITTPSGRVFQVTAPEGSSQDDVLAFAQKYTPKSAKEEVENDAISKAAREAAKPGGDGASQTALNALGSIARGAGSIGATLLAPLDMAKDAIDGKGLSLASNRQRRADMDAAVTDLGVDRDSLTYKAGKVVTEVAGTAGVGNVLAMPVRAVSALSARAGAGAIPALDTAATALGSGGFVTGAKLSPMANIATRGAAGVTTGGVSAGLVNPDEAGLGAIVGGVVPPALHAAGAVGATVRKGMQEFLGAASPEVRDLALKAEQLGIRIPADRILDSDSLNAMAASLRYVPLSGRTKTEKLMEAEMNQALSRTFGQDTSNLTKAFNNAQLKLGTQFDSFLRNNTVHVDKQFVDDLAEVSSMAARELPSDGAGVITRQIDEIVAKAGTGEIDGQAAYAIKRTLDRIGKRNSPEGWYALELKGKLMDALNRSVGPQEAAGFAKLRKQYQAMLELEQLGAKNGVEGTVTAARLANMKDIRNGDVKELADIAQQFLRPREGAHGAAQRVGVGAAVTAASGVLGGPLGAVVGAGGLIAGGRGANAVLNSETARRAAMNSGIAPAAGLPGNSGMGLLSGTAARALPVAGAAALATPVGAEPPPPQQPAPVPTDAATPILPQKTSALEADPAQAVAAIGSAQDVDSAIAAAAHAAAAPMPVVESDSTPPAIAASQDAQPMQDEPTQVASLMDTAATRGDVDGGPVVTWSGRRGSGYLSPDDALRALPSRQRADPDLNWRVEETGRGTFVLAGYDSGAQGEQGLATAEPERAVAEMTPGGNALVTGPDDAVREFLAQRGITQFMRSARGVVVARSQAERAVA